MSTLKKRNRSQPDVPGSTWIGSDAPADAIGRRCPRCRRRLEWTERRTTGGRLFDYYRRCPKGCGMFCYDHLLHRMIRFLD